MSRQWKLDNALHFTSIIPCSISTLVHFHIYATTCVAISKPIHGKFRPRHPLLFIIDRGLSTLHLHIRVGSNQFTLTFLDRLYVVWQEENMELKRQKADRGDDYEWNDYMSLPFTQNVISETLRLANIVNAIWRKATKDVEIKGYVIPNGNCVVASLMSVHMDGTIYEKPYEFNPWRWEKDQRMEGRRKDKYEYSPFGGGQRLCPGLEVSRLELFIFLHQVVTTCTWHARPDHIRYFPTVKMSRKLPISVKPLVYN